MEVEPKQTGIAMMGYKPNYRMKNYDESKKIFFDKYRLRELQFSTWGYS